MTGNARYGPAAASSRASSARLRCPSIPQEINEVMRSRSYESINSPLLWTASPVSKRWLYRLRRLKPAFSASRWD